MLERERNHHELARTLLEHSLALFRRSGDLLFIALVSTNLGYLFLKLDLYDKAEDLFRQQLEIDQKLHFWQGIADGWFNLGYLYRQKGEVQQASEFTENCVLVCREHGLTTQEPYLQSGMLALHLNDFIRAGHRFNSLLQHVEKEDKFHVSIYLIGLAAVSGGTHRPERAAKLFGAAQVIFETIQMQPTPWHLDECDRHLQSSREQIGISVFETLVAEGCKMSTEEALQLALEH